MVLPAPGLSDAHAHALNARAHAHGRSTLHEHPPLAQALRALDTVESALPSFDLFDKELHAA